MSSASGGRVRWVYVDDGERGPCATCSIAEFLEDCNYAEPDGGELADRVVALRPGDALEYAGGLDLPRIRIERVS